MVLWAYIAVAQPIIHPPVNPKNDKEKKKSEVVKENKSGTASSESKNKKNDSDKGGSDNNSDAKKGRIPGYGDYGAGSHESAQQRKNMAMNEYYYPYITKAHEGDAEAQYKVGFYYYYYGDVRSEGLTWWEKSAGQGNVDAMKSLSHAYYKTNKQYNLPIDLQKAFHWTREAANNGVQNLYMLTGFLYQMGVEGIARPDSARMWYVRTLEKFNNPRNSYCLGAMSGISMLAKGIAPGPKPQNFTLDDLATKVMGVFPTPGSADLIKAWADYYGYSYTYGGFDMVEMRYGSEQEEIFIENIGSPENIIFHYDGGFERANHTPGIWCNIKMTSDEDANRAVAEMRKYFEGKNVLFREDAKSYKGIKGYYDGAMIQIYASNSYVHVGRE